MSLTLEEIKQKHDRAYNHNEETRRQSADDLVFYWVTQWDDSLLSESSLQYRGEFNIIRKGGRQVIADLRANPVSVDFTPVDDDREDGADFMDGLYRTDTRNNVAIEAYDNAMMEAVVCGVGGWLRCTEYKLSRGRSLDQVIRRKPIVEFNNNVFYDPNAKLADKSDADYVGVLHAYSENGYEALMEEHDQDYDGINASNFASPEHSYTFPWIGGEDKKIYIVEFYHRELIKGNIVTLEDPFGDEREIFEHQIKEIEDELLDEGFQITSSREIEHYQVTRYLCSGEGIIDESVIAGEHIPVVPVYGERAFVEGQEHYEGVTRLAKDPQRLRNFQLSYLADISSRSPRPKPIFDPKQIEGFEWMYEEAGADNHLPYTLQHGTDQDGNPLPMGPAVLPEQPVPTALTQLIGESRAAVEDVVNPGIPQDIADPDLSGKAVIALQNRLDMQSMVYQQNMKHAIRRDAQIYASMASEVHDAPQKVTLTASDGTQTQAQVMEQVIDKETGMPVTINDITNMEFEVYADIGPSYTTQKEQTLDRLSEMRASLAPGDPMANILMLKSMVLMDGVDFDDVREYANKQLLLLGIREPRDEEEEQILIQAQQSQNQPDPALLLAQAEQLKGQADVIRAQTDTVKVQADIQDQQISTSIDAYKAQTDRLDTQVAAQKAGAELRLKEIDMQGKNYERQFKAAQGLRGSASLQR